MDEIYQRFEQADTAQALVCLEDAFAYGVQSLPFYLEALYHDAIAVRAKAYAQLQSLAGGEGRSPSQLEQWLKTLQNIIEPDEVQTALERGIPLFSGDVVYQVYMSAIDYDDNNYSLLDSMEAVSAHDFQYEDFSARTDTLLCISTCLFLDQARQIAEDFHRTILSRKSYHEFTQNQSVVVINNFVVGLPEHINFSSYYNMRWSEFDRDFCLPIRDWCIEHSLDIEFEESEYEFDCFEEQDLVFDYLEELKDYRLLSEFCEFVGMGKFAFVHEKPIQLEVDYFRPF